MVLNLNFNQGKQGLRLARQYFGAMDRILNETQTQRNFSAVHRNTFRLMSTENRKIVNIVKAMINISDNDQLSADPNRNVIPEDITDKGLDYIAFLIADNYKNATNYTDKLMKLLIDEQCEYRYFSDANTNLFCKIMSTKINNTKLLATNISIQMVCELSSKLIKSIEKVLSVIRKCLVEGHCGRVPRGTKR